MNRIIKIFSVLGIIVLISILCFLVLFTAGLFITDTNIAASNGGDYSSALEREKKAEIKELNIEVLTNRENELVFSFSINDFIDSYNGCYWEDKKRRYLTPAADWSVAEYDTAIHSEYKTYYYHFTEDATIWTLPTITVYVPSNADYIQEITLNFDDHSYTGKMYALYEEICFYTLKVFFSDLKDKEIVELYKALNKLAYDNIFPQEKGYASNPTPCALYYKNGIGLYPYFAIGQSVRLCIIPVTEQTINEFKQKGVEIYEIL